MTDDLFKIVLNWAVLTPLPPVQLSPSSSRLNPRSRPDAMQEARPAGRTPSRGAARGAASSSRGAWPAEEPPPARGAACSRPLGRDARPAEEPPPARGTAWLAASRQGHAADGTASRQERPGRGRSVHERTAIVAASGGPRRHGQPHRGRHHQRAPQQARVPARHRHRRRLRRLHWLGILRRNYRRRFRHAFSRRLADAHPAALAVTRRDALPHR